MRVKHFMKKKRKKKETKKLERTVQKLSSLAHLP